MSNILGFVQHFGFCPTSKYFQKLGVPQGRRGEKKEEKEQEIVIKPLKNTIYLSKFQKFRLRRATFLPKNMFENTCALVGCATDVMFCPTLRFFGTISMLAPGAEARVTIVSSENESKFKSLHKSQCVPATVRKQTMVKNIFQKRICDPQK